MINGNWKFWFMIIGGLLTASGMFWNLKVDLTRTQIELEHVKRDVSDIKRIIEGKHYANHPAFQSR